MPAPISFSGVPLYRRVMALTRLSLTNFRNHSDLILSPGSGFVVLTGENGAGKTNILEAISLLSPGRGLRGAALSDMARQSGPGGFGIAAQLDDVGLATGTHPGAPDRRIVRINGAQGSATGLSEWLSLIWITPAMDRLFMEGASERRRFLDRLVLALDPTHAGHASRYEAAMRQRNRLLSSDMPPDLDWVSAVEAQMFTHGAALALARQQLVLTLAEQLAKTDDGPFARAGLALEGWQWADDFVQQLAASRARDAAAGRTLVGPHRCDLAVTHVGKNQPAARCSTGEQKALLMGIILAHADLVETARGHRPLLLLDEVAAHLDPLRREALYDRLRPSGGQVWMTGTEAAPFAPLGADATRINLP
jgi:DNA replication and repair protein RecF